MNGSHLAWVLPAIAFALALPVWAVEPSEQTNENGTTVSQASIKSEAATSMQSDVGDSSKPQGSAKQQPHGPTAIMDRATSTENSDDADAAGKHPPTGRMDRSTPDQKSPSTKSDSDVQEQGAAK